MVDYPGDRIVQFSHFSVKDYLTSNRLATSNHHLESAHATLTRACLAILFDLDEHVDGFNLLGTAVTE